MVKLHARAKTQAQNLPKPLEVHWRWHYEPDSRKVWRNDWFGDQFEIVDQKGFEEIQRVCALVSIRLIEQED